MNKATWEVLAHVSVAVSTYVQQAERQARRDGGRVPSAELVALAGGLADLVDRDRPRQDPPPDAPPVPRAHPGTMTTPREPPLLTKEEAATLLRCSTRTLERLVARDEVQTVLVRGGVRIRRADLDAYVAGLQPRTFRDATMVKASA